MYMDLLQQMLLYTSSSFTKAISHIITLQSVLFKLKQLAIFGLVTTKLELEGNFILFTNNLTGVFRCNVNINGHHGAASCYSDQANPLVGIQWRKAHSSSSSKKLNLFDSHMLSIGFRWFLPCKLPGGAVSSTSYNWLKSHNLDVIWHKK